jgi:hypothetical protein
MPSIQASNHGCARRVSSCLLKTSPPVGSAERVAAVLGSWMTAAVPGPAAVVRASASPCGSACGPPPRTARDRAPRTPCGPCRRWSLTIECSPAAIQPSCNVRTTRPVRADRTGPRALERTRAGSLRARHRPCDGGARVRTERSRQQDPFLSEQGDSTGSIGSFSLLVWVPRPPRRVRGRIGGTAGGPVPPKPEPPSRCPATTSRPAG